MKLLFVIRSASIIIVWIIAGFLLTQGFIGIIGGLGWVAVSGYMARDVFASLD
jgi:hypothetical protein